MSCSKCTEKGRHAVDSAVRHGVGVSGAKELHGRRDTRAVDAERARRLAVQAYLAG
jgi:hypothetical protein